MSQSAKLTTGSINGHLVAQTLPTIIGVAAMISVGIVDSYFLGQLGTAELAVVSFVTPVFMVITSLGIGLMAGISSVVSRSLGAKNFEEASRLANFGMALAVVLGILFAVVFFIVRRPLFAAMGADPELLPLIDEYVLPICFSIPIMLMIMGMNGIFRAQGEAKRSSAVNIIYSAVNWVLDPFLITGAFGIGGFGVSGAAYATFIAYVVALVFGFYQLNKTGLTLQASALKSGDGTGALRPIVRVAAPASIANAINPVGMTVLTGLVAIEGAAAVAGFGAGGRFQAFMLVPLYALSGAIGAVVGQNWGAGQYSRARQAWIAASIFCVGYGLVMAVILFVTREWVAGLFSDDPRVINEFGNYIAISAWGYVGFGVLIVSNGAFNAIDRANTSLIQSVMRVFLVMLPFAWVMRGVWGSEAIYAGELAANFFGGIIATIVALKIFRKRES